MSIVTDLQATRRVEPQSPEDPFRYGWRYVPHEQSDGTTTYTEVPLTIEDVLHPQMGDVILESSLHDLIKGYLTSVARLRTAADPTALVLSDCGIYWDDPALPFTHHSPDVSVIFGVRRQRVNWNSFHVAKEGVRPRVLMEVVSVKVRDNDVVTKLEHYHLVQVPMYIIVDRQDEDGPCNILGYTYTAAKYVPMQKDAQGRLWVQPLGIWLEAKGEKVVCYDGNTGQIIGDYLEISRQLAQQAAQLQQEQQRAEAEQQRAAAEQAKAEQEKRRADAAETRIRQLEADLRRLQNRTTPEGDAK